MHQSHFTPTLRCESWTHAAAVAGFTLFTHEADARFGSCWDVQICIMTLWKGALLVRTHTAPHRYDTPASTMLKNEIVCVLEHLFLRVVCVVSLSSRRVLVLQAMLCATTAVAFEASAAAAPMVADAVMEEAQDSSSRRAQVVDAALFVQQYPGATTEWWANPMPPSLSQPAATGSSPFLPTTSPLGGFVSPEQCTVACTASPSCTDAKWCGQCKDKCTCRGDISCLCLKTCQHSTQSTDPKWLAQCQNRCNCRGNAQCLCQSDCTFAPGSGDPATLNKCKDRCTCQGNHQCLCRKACLQSDQCKDPKWQV